MGSPVPSNGFDEGFGFLGWETSYGTAVTSLDQWWRDGQCTLRRRDEPLALEAPTGSYSDMLFTGAATNNNRWHWGTKIINGQLIVGAEYDDIGLLLSSAMGHPSSVAFGGGDTGAFAHAFALTQARVTSMPNSFTGQVVRGNIASGSPDRRFTGCMVDSLEIMARENRIVSATAGLIAQDVTEVDDSITTGNISAAPWIDYHHGVVRRDAALSTPDSGDNLTAGKDAIDWTLSIRNNLRVAGSQGRYQGASGDYNVIRPPVYTGLREVMLTMSADYFDDGMDDLMYTQSAPGGGVRSWSVFLESGITIVGSKTFSLEFLIPRGLVLGDLTEYSGGPGINNQPIRVKSVAGATNLLSATLQNGTTNAAGVAYLGSQV